MNGGNKTSCRVSAERTLTGLVAPAALLKPKATKGSRNTQGLAKEIPKREIPKNYPTDIQEIP